MKTDELTMTPLNLTYEDKRTHEAIDQIYKAHEKTASTLKQIFSSPEGNSYSRAADAASAYQQAAKEAGAKATAAIENAKAEVQVLKDDFYDRSKGQDFRTLSQITEWANYLQEVTEEQALNILEGNDQVKQAALQWDALYPDEEDGVIKELLLRSFEDSYPDQLDAPKELETLLPILQESFTTTLEADFTHHSSHNYLESAEILAARVV